MKNSFIFIVFIFLLINTIISQEEDLSAPDFKMNGNLSIDTSRQNKFGIAIVLGMLSGVAKSQGFTIID